MWESGYFCGTVGAVDEATIRKYIENQRKEEVDNFTIEEQQLLTVKLLGDFSRKGTGFSLQTTFSRKKRPLD